MNETTQHKKTPRIDLLKVRKYSNADDHYMMSIDKYNKYNNRYLGQYEKYRFVDFHDWMNFLMTDSLKEIEYREAHGVGGYHNIKRTLDGDYNE